DERDLRVPRLHAPQAAQVPAGDAADRRGVLLATAMILSETAIPGAYIVEPQRHTDSRGYFVRHWCQREFAQAGLDVQLVQASSSFNLHRHTVRGMHLQVPPALEGKLIRCIAGAILDVIIDLRPDSRTFLQ